MTKQIHVYDCDGVLVDTSHRYKNLADGTIDLAYWYLNSTKERIALDKLLPLAKQYRDACFNPETYTIVCTSRVQDQLDIDFIVNKLGMPDKLIMRPVGNTEADHILKYRQLQRLFNLKQFHNVPRYFWDDNLNNLRECASLFTDMTHVKSQQGA